MKKTIVFIVLTAFCSLDEGYCQWNFNGDHIFNTNPGFVGIGTSSPTTLLYVAKNMTEPNITVRNLGGTGGATYTMTDDASGANWKFKATLSGGFKIRDHAHSLDVIVIEPGSFANAIYIKNTDNIGIGTSTPASSALVDLSSTSKGFLPPRMTLAQMQAIQNPADGLLVYCTTDQKFYLYTQGGSGWKSLWFGSGPIFPDFTCGTPITIAHQVGEVAPVNKTVTYGTWWIGAEEELCWITQNLGADHQATAKDDITEASAGWYWQFNLMQGYKHDGTTRIPNTGWISEIYENSDWITANDPCALELGPGWRLPTETEWNNYMLYFGWNDLNDPFNHPLKLHLAGHLNMQVGYLSARGLMGDYWSSSEVDLGYANYFEFVNWGYLTIQQKSEGMSVRCVKFIPYN